MPNTPNTPNMSQESRQALKDILGVTQVAQISPSLIQRLQSAARELLTSEPSTPVKK
jgi:hypothetical protein